MVTRAGARGRMVSLQEAMNTLATTSERRAAPNKKQLDAIASSLMEALNKKMNQSQVSESALNKAIDAWITESKMEIDPKHIDGLKKTLAKHVGKEIMGKGAASGRGDDSAVDTDAEDDEEEDDGGVMGEGVTGDSDIDDMLDDEDPDNDGDDDLDPDDDTDQDAAGKKKKEAERKKEAARLAALPEAQRVRETAAANDAKEVALLKAQLAESQAENKRFKTREAMSDRRATAFRIVKEMGVKAKESREYLIGEIVARGGSEKAMREYAKRTYEALIKPITGDGA